MEFPSLQLRSKTTFLSLVLLVVIVAFIATRVNWTDAGQALSKADLTLVAVAAVIELVSLGLKTVRWKILLSDIKANVPLSALFKIQLAGTAISNATPARLGEPVKVLYLEKYGLKKRFTLLTVLWERIFDLAAIVLFAIAALTGDNNIIMLLSGLVILAVILTYNLAKIAKYFAKLPWLAFLSDIGLHKFKKRTLLASFAVTAASWILDLGAVWLAFSAVGINLPYLQVSSAYAASLLVGILSTIPGGLGSLEATSYILLQKAVPSTALLAAALITARIVTLGVVFAAGGVAIAMLRSEK